MRRQFTTIARLSVAASIAAAVTAACSGNSGANVAVVPTDQGSGDSTPPQLLDSSLQGRPDAKGPTRLPDASLADAGGSDSSALSDGGCRSPNALLSPSDSRWCAVDTLVAQSLAAPASLPGLSFEVFTTDANGLLELQYSRSLGTLKPASGGAAQTASPTLAVATASAGKYLTGITVLRAKSILAGTSAAFDLNTTVSTLGCSGLPADRQTISLYETMHQTAGVDENDAPCLGDASFTLEQCACAILTSSIKYPPHGTRFAYGANNFALSAAIANHALAAGSPSRTFQQVANELQTTLGVPSAEFAFPPPNQWGAGYRISGRGYAQYLGLAAPGPGAGKHNGVQLVAPADLADMSLPFGGSVTTSYSPFVAGGGQDFRYGAGSWVQCTAPWTTPTSWPAVGSAITLSLDYATCPVRIQHSLGAQGFLPWVRFPSASGRGHIAVLATQNTAMGRVSVNSLQVFQMIEPILGEILP